MDFIILSLHYNFQKFIILSFYPLFFKFILVHMASIDFLNNKRNNSQSGKLKQLFIFLFLSLHFQIIQTQSIIKTQQQSNCISKCTSLSYYSCQICYQKCSQPNSLNISNQNVMNFTFQSCQQKYCAHYQTTVFYDNDNISHTKIQCTKYQQRILQQNQCISWCCDKNSTDSKFTAQTLQRCIQKNQQLKKFAVETGVIVGISIGGLFFAALIVVLIRCTFDKCKKYKFKCKLWNKKNKKDLDNLYIMNQKTIQTTQQQFQKSNKINSEEKQTNFSQLVKQQNLN